MQCKHSPINCKDIDQFAGNRILSYGGKLSLRQMFSTGGYPAVSERGTDVVLVSDDLSIYWSNPNTIRNDESLVRLTLLFGNYISDTMFSYLACITWYNLQNIQFRD